MKMPQSDLELIQQLQQQNKDALYILYDRYSAALYGVILRMCKNETDAQDILQETFIKIWEKIEQYDSTKGKFYTWAYRIAKNTTLNALRKPDKLIQSDDLSVYDNNKEVDIQPDFTALNGSLQKLEAHHQQAISLVYFEGYTHREAHEKMGVPLGTFKSYIRQALTQLRKHYAHGLILLLAIPEMIG